MDRTQRKVVPTIVARIVALFKVVPQVVSPNVAQSSVQSTLKKCFCKGCQLQKQLHLFKHLHLFLIFLIRITVGFR